MPDRVQVVSDPEVQLRVVAVRANLAGMVDGRLPITPALLCDQVQMLDMALERLAGREVA